MGPWPQAPLGGISPSGGLSGGLKERSPNKPLCRENVFFVALGPLGDPLVPGTIGITYNPALGGRNIRVARPPWDQLLCITIQMSAFLRRLRGVAPKDRESWIKPKIEFTEILLKDSWHHFKNFAWRILSETWLSTSNGPTKMARKWKLDELEFLEFAYQFCATWVSVRICGFFTFFGVV